ncbi:MAG: RluA family pseudouridine synthase [Eubacterium sp.]|nr:RluA family pseudouridine synthase [Eubacterium sp.]
MSMILPSQGQYLYHYNIQVKKALPVKEVLVRRYGYSSRLLRQIKREGTLTINGRDCWLTDTVENGDEVTITFPEETFDFKAVAGPLDIVYEDDEVLVANKAYDCVTHPTKSHQEDTLANYVAWHWQSLGVKSKVRFVNRLDRDTSGLVVIAKNKYVHHYIQSRMKGEEVTKTYIAFTNGVPQAPAGTIRAPIGRISQDSIERQVMASGKMSVTHYEVLEDYGDAAMVRLVLETGRTHQIRVHLKHIGCPIIGDSLYNTGDNPDYGIKRQALHAAGLVFPLPKSGKTEVRADLTEDLKTLRQRLRLKMER